jgi:trehalose 2-sulfotransferase
MPPDRSYFISTTPRTGSFLLAHALESTGIAGRPQEYFDPNFEELWLQRLGIASDAEFFGKILPEGTTPNGVFAAKVHWHQFEYLGRKLQAAHGDGRILDLLKVSFPDLRYVFLTRRDKVRQAVSYYRAIETNVWWSAGADSRADQDPPAPAPEFDYERIDYWVTRLRDFETSWRRHFERAGVKPFEVSYEEFVVAYQPTVLAILRYLELPVTEGLRIAAPRLEKQADELSETWVRRYWEMRQG